MRVFFSVGEPSGDHHAAQLITQLRQRCPKLHAEGFGGPHMREVGCETLYPLTELAVMGVSQVLPHLKQFYDLVGQAREHFRTHRPDCVVLVDFPGFNWWIARAAHREGIPVYYYCAPQLWAWAPWRIRRVRKHVDCVLSVLPFEAEWYRSRGVKVEYVGHPFFDEVAEHELDAPTLAQLRSSSQRQVAILPGSRRQEVNANFPHMLQAMRQLHALHPEVRFPVACYKQWHHDRCRELIGAEFAQLPIDLYTGRTSEVLAAADCSLMVSGSVSLELLARRVPAVVMYKGTVFTELLVRMLITCKYMSLPNLVADRELMPEFPFSRNFDQHIRGMVSHLDRWLSEPLELAAVRTELDRLADAIVETGGVARAAEVILELLDHRAPAKRAA
ncbi:MAG: lipid-A-disaccharide synthase [Planctomycetaceae bacterium]|nr:lipid-A-disaccharide synthase [Planctomycetaceae bacterium]